MADKSLTVTAPLATPYRQDGTRAYLYEGSDWPDGLREGETERFVDLGFLGEKQDDAPAEKPARKSAK